MVTHTTGKGLNQDEAFVGLVDFGLFAEKTPPCFNSSGLSAHITKEMKRILTENDSNKLNKVLNKFTHSQVRYQSLRDINTPRQLSIPHPESYLAHCLVIKRVWEKIQSHCAELDEPKSRIYVQKTASERIFTMSYKGSDRFGIEEKDIEYQCGASHIVSADISKCFPSIYTHSIPWAIHGKQHAKKKRRDLTLEGNLLDKACQILSDKQTNGIAIGPHSSNVISEIILTKIDTSLHEKGYINFFRNIDDYTFFAKSFQQSEDFIRDLNMALREYELYLNDKKTLVKTVPQPATTQWVNELNRFIFSNGIVRYSEVRSFLDLALALANSSGSSAVLNYAIKTIPERLNDRARKMLTAEAINLCLAYPYLAPIMHVHVFDKHPHTLTKQQIENFIRKLVCIGINKVYPDSIAFSLYYSKKYDCDINLSECDCKKIIAIDDCLVNVLLWDYAAFRSLTEVLDQLESRADELNGLDVADQDLQWLFLYTVWDAEKLRDNKQTFLAELKNKSVNFVEY